MELIGLILTYILGVSILYNISSKFDILEILGFSFLVGIGIQTFLMFFLNLLSFKYNIQIILALSILIIVLLIIRTFIIKRPYQNFTKRLKNLFKAQQLGSYNIIWLGCLVLVVSVVYLISIKSLFWPTFANDSLGSFDVFAKGLANEGKIINSLILEKRVGYGAAYPPLYSLSLAYSYMLGFELSKIIPVLFFISIAISFYSVIKKLTTPTNAMLFTLLAISSPELLAQSAINITSVPQAIYAALSIITIIAWHKLKDIKYFYLSAIMMGFNAFTRSEGVVYIFPVLLFLFIHCLKTKAYKNNLLYLVISLMPFVLWQFFLKLNGAIMNDFVQVELIKHPNFDLDKIKKILTLSFHAIKRTQYFGVTFYAFIVMILLNSYNIIKKKSDLWLLSIIFLSFFGYLTLINQIHLKSDTISNIINYSGKRFFFGYILLMWFYIASNALVKKAFLFMEERLNFKKPKIQGT